MKNRIFVLRALVKVRRENSAFFEASAGKDIRDFVDIVEKGKWVTVTIKKNAVLPVKVRHDINNAFSVL